MKKFIYLFFTITIIFSSCSKEEGCTDSLAINYNVDAENDDGSCEYGVVGGEWVTQSITTSGSMTVSLAGITMLDSAINYTETNADSLEPYKLIFNENSSYLVKNMFDLTPIFFDRILSFSIELFVSTFFLLNSIKPDVGLSINDSKFNNVDFPEPEGPIIEI